MWTRLATLLAPLLLLLSCATSPPETHDARGDFIRFVAQNGIMKANGIFHDWRVVGSHIDRGDLGASFVDLEIDVASIDTGIARRDDHLRDPDFFEAERWPTARVRVSDVRLSEVPPSDPRSAGEPDAPHFKARFKIEIRDQSATLDGDFAVVSDDPLVVEGKIEIDRVVFGVGTADSWWNPTSPRNQVPVHFRVTLE